MIKKLEKIKSWHIFAATATALTLAFLSVCSYHFITETSRRKNGSLQQQTIAAADFQLIGMENYGDGHFKAVTDDSQMIYPAEMKFSSMRFKMTYSVNPGEIVLYYKEPGDEHFSSKKRRWIHPDDSVENGYIVTMPMKTVTEIRFDPTMYPGNDLTLSDFSLNEEKSIGEYFAVPAERIFDLILYTLVISACLKYGLDFVLKKFDE